MNHRPDQNPVAGQANLPKLSETTTKPKYNAPQDHRAPATPRDDHVTALGTCNAAHEGIQARKKLTTTKEENLEKLATSNHYGHHSQMKVKKEKKERQPQHKHCQDDTTAKMD